MINLPKLNKENPKWFGRSILPKLLVITLSYILLKDNLQFWHDENIHLEAAVSLFDILQSKVGYRNL